MRRKDRQMDKEFALKVIDESQYASLGLVTDTGVMLRVLSVVIYVNQFRPKAT